MSEKSAIEWTDATWNPVRGCTKISSGCKNCYAETFAERWRGIPGHPYEHGFDPRTVPSSLDIPLRRKKPTTWFVNSMSDLFHEAFSDEYIGMVFGVMAGCPQHTFQVLTKRPERMREVLTRIGKKDDVGSYLHEMQKHGVGYHHPKRTAVQSGHPWPLPNVWLGTSVEREDYVERCLHLSKCPAAVRFVSAEPLLGPLDLSWYLRSGPDWNYYAGPCAHGRDPWTRCDDDLDDKACDYSRPGIDWVIVGGESGPGARPCDVSWIRSIVEQCKAAGVPVFVKQDSGPKPGKQGRIPDDLWRRKEFPHAS